jgi:PKHD-type hydroxylase
MESRRNTVFNWGKILSDTQLREIEAAAETLELSPSEISEDNTAPSLDIRVTTTGFFNAKEHSRILELGSTISGEANRKLYGFLIDAAVEAQLAVYKGSDGAHYNWHTDVGWADSSMYDRKITTTIILSNPEEYEGGALEFEGGELYTNVPRGTVITLPSYIRHKVHPVTKGIRVALVFWASGPRFR